MIYNGTLSRTFSEYTDIALSSMWHIKVWISLRKNSFEDLSVPHESKYCLTNNKALAMNPVENNKKDLEINPTTNR